MLKSDRREVIVSKIFKYLTKNEKIMLSPDIIKNSYNAEFHPALKSLNRNSFEIFGEFSDCLSV